MPSKEQSKRKDKGSRQQRLPKPTTNARDLGTQQQAPLTPLLQRAQLDPHSVSPRDVQLLQRAIGNRAVGRLLAGRVQRQPENDPQKLSVASIGDETVQRKPLTEQQEEEYTAIVDAVNENNQWDSPTQLADVLAELKKLLADDITILAELKQVFVDQEVKLVGSAEKGAGNYDSSGNEMTIFTQGAMEMADTIIFESGNARRRAGFEGAGTALKKRQSGGLEKVGEAMSDLESGTTLDYLDHILNMVASGRTYFQLPPGAKRQFKHFMGKYPSYFNMDAKRKAQFRETYKDEMRDSPHEAKANEGERMHLTTKDLYAYEKVVAKMSVSGVLSTVKGYIEKKKAIKLGYHYWSGGKYMNVKDKLPPMKRTGSDVIPDDSRGKFYVDLVDRASYYYKVDLGDIEFNDAQKEVAENEHATTGWDPNGAFETPGVVWEPPPDAYTW